MSTETVTVLQRQSERSAARRDCGRRSRAGNDAMRVAQGHSSDIDTVYAVAVGGAAARLGQPATAASQTQPGTRTRGWRADTA